MNPNFEIIQLKVEDIRLLRNLLQLFNEVFEVTGSIELSDFYLEELLMQKHFVALVAIDKEQLIGGLTGYQLLRYNAPRAEFFIYDLAVKKEFQRKGVGTLLLTETQKICRDREIQEIFVAAHREDQHALEFYKSRGGLPDEVVHFTFSTT